MGKRRKKSAARKATPEVPVEGQTKTAEPPPSEPSGSSCFVLIPFRDPFETVYLEAIEPAIIAAGLEPTRGDSVFHSSDIIADVWSKIQEATALVAVLTGKNTNVFYELGLAHAIRRPVVLVSSTLDDVPFDLRHLRIALYDKEHPAWGARLTKEITLTLKAVLQDAAAGVPKMFRAPVERQEVDGGWSVRLEELERTVAQLEEEHRQGSAWSGSDLISELTYLSNRDQAAAWAKRARALGLARERIETLLRERIPLAEVPLVMKQLPE